MFFKRNKDKKKNEPVLAVVIANTVNFEIYQDILKKNEIPFICRQQGAGGYLKVVTGGYLSADSIYVKAEDLDRAKELYEIYINSEDFPDSEEQ